MTTLRKKLNLYGLTMISVGGCIGSGIFITPAEVTQAVPHHLLVLIVWALGGFIAMTGALTFAELGGMFPQAGGVYVYLKEAYGDAVGFLYGWITLLVITTGALAALGIAFAEYMTFFFPMSQTVKILLAVLTIVGLTVINIIGVDVSQVFANVFTGLKLAAIGGIILVGFLFFDPAVVQLDFSPSSIDVPGSLLPAVFVGLIGVFWSIGGWHHASYVAGEAINAEKTVPRAMVLGVLIVTITYVLVNLAYMLLLPLDVIAQTERVAGDAVQTVFSFGGKMVAIAIALAIFGSIGIYTMSAPRIYFAMAKDKVFFQGLSYIHPKYQTPVYAMLIQAGWAVFLLFFWGSFGQLITYVIFMDILFMTLAGFSIFIFRKNRKELERPIKALGYPIVPALFVIISGAFVISTFFERPEQTWAGLILLGLGLPVYYYFKKQNR